MHLALGRLLIVAAVLSAAGFAVPAGAAPIFGTATVSPDALSPNGDDVQDVAVITYQILPDSADVRVLLAVPGGAVVGTLQVFTRQGAGLHSLPFDGTIGGGDVPDGNYEIRIFGSNSQGPETESRALPLLVDRVAPVISAWTLPSGASSTVQNGDTVTLQGCVDADAETAFVDLGALDSGFNPGLVAESPLPPVCRLFTYTITAGNTVVDADQIPAVLEARDRAGNRSTATLFLCLSNFPPTVSQPGVLLDEIPFFQNGDELTVRVGFSSPYPLTVTADLSNLDSLFDPDSVVVTQPQAGIFDVNYRIRPGNSRPDGEYPVRIIAFDPGCGTAEDATALMTLDNAGENSALVEAFTAAPDAFSPSGNGFKQTTIRFTTLVDSLFVVIATDARLKGEVQPRNLVLFNAELTSQGVYSVVWDGSAPGVTPDDLEDQNLTMTLRAVSFPLDRQRSVFTSLEVDSKVPQLTGFPRTGQVAAQNGQTVNLPVSYDRSGYGLSVDFTAVDSNFDPGTSTVVVADSSGGKYGIFYSVSPTNSTPDSTGIPVPLTAIDRAGNSAVTATLVSVCLNNLPPRLVSTGFLEDSGPFRNGERILITTTWATEPGQSNLELIADLSAVDTNFNPQTRPATVVVKAGGVYEISYTLSSNNGITEGVDIPVVVTAYDGATEGCGSTRVTAVTVDIDSRAGSAPTFDPLPPEVVREAILPLSGRAAGSDSVEIRLGGAPVDTFGVDPTTQRFQGQIRLASGDNVIIASGFDRAGNVTLPSGQAHVFLATGTLFTVPPAFRPGAEFFLVLEEPADALVLRIFSLEGIEIRRLESGAGDLYRVPWDGRDHTGTLSSSGPCLVVAEVGRGGQVQEKLRKAFVFARQGEEP